MLVPKKYWLVTKLKKQNTGAAKKVQENKLNALNF
jgi:hypothetical protein